MIPCAAIDMYSGAYIHVTLKKKKKIKTVQFIYYYVLNGLEKTNLDSLLKV